MVHWKQKQNKQNQDYAGDKICRSLMGNVIETVRSMCSDYWAAYVRGKIKTDGLKQHTQTDVITH